MGDELDFSGLNFQGWVNDPAWVQEIIAADSVKPVGEYLAPNGGRVERTDLTLYLKKLYGDKWYLMQGSCGSCVAFGAALAVDILTAIQVVDNGAERPPGRTDPTTIYWGSRVEIGGGRIMGQGSVGAWAAKWLKDYGVIPQGSYPGIDLTTYDAAVCCGRQSRQGVPDSLEPIARQHPVKSYAQVRSFEEMARAIENGYPVTVASNQGFTKHRDEQGFASPSGSWAHQMCIVGVRHDRPGALLANSWGPYYSGGPADLSPAVKWVDSRTIERMLSQGDSFALSDLAGWKPKGLNYARLNW